MPKGSPNDSTMKLNFVAKVYDPVAKDYKPIYIAPDATDKIRGDVYLSDATNGTDNAATGVTAATPAAVKSANDNANNRVSKTETTDQVMAGSLLPKTTNTKNLGSSAAKWANVYATTFTGELSGNATTASTLKTARKITVQNGEYSAGAGSADFNGGSAITIKIAGLDASTLQTGTVPIERLPQGALERLVHVADQAARFKLTTTQVQLGDIVQQDDTGVMYVVVDESKLTSAAGYSEFTAGTATQAKALSPGATIQTSLGSESAVTFTGTTNITPGVTGTLPVKHGGTGATTLGQYGVLVGEGTSAIQSIGATSTGAVYKSTAAANPTIGTLPVAQGGTGITSNPSMKINLASTAADTVFKASPTPGVSGTLPIGNGGTNATTAEDAWSNLGGGSVGKLNLNSSTSQFLRGDGTWQTVTTEDTKTTQTNTTAATAYPILLKNGTGTGAVTNGVLFNSGITVTPSTSTITATNFAGKATSAGTADTATSATKLASSFTLSLTGNVTGSTTLDGSGNASITATIADNAVVTSKINASAVTAAKLASDSVTTVKILDGNVTAAKLASNAVTTVKITDKNVTGAKIADATITETQLADGAVTSSKIKDGTIVAADIADSTITNAKLVDTTIESGKIKDSAITTAKINGSAVTTAKLADKNITLAKLADEVSTMYVGTTEPTDSHIKIWITP